VLAANCWPGDTWYQCCPVFVGVVTSTTIATSYSVVDTAIAKALVLGVHALAREGFLLLAVALLGLLFLVRSAAA
jgi:hypothetical protein